MKKRVNISLDEETIMKIKELSEEVHKNVSQWITDAVWKEAEKSNNDKNKNEGQE